MKTLEKGVLKLLVVFITSLATFNLPAYAGWIEVDKSGDITYMSEGRVKNVPSEKGDVWTIIDVNSGNFTMVDPKKKKYAVFSPDEYCKAVSAAQEKMMGDMTTEERAAMEKFMKMQGMNRRKFDVSVIKIGSGGKIAGFNTVKYKVKASGRVVKEVWISTDVSLMKFFKKYYKKARELHRKFQSCITQMGMGSTAGGGIEDSAEYQELESKGWVMKEISRDEIEYEVLKIEKKNIPESEFNIPSGYTKVSLDRMME